MMNYRPQLRLGELIAMLTPVNQMATVQYDFGGLHPNGLDSYRGYYEQLAFGFGEEAITADGVLTLARGAIGTFFTGYKGGDYMMHSGTPLWVANRGRCHGTAIVGVIDLDYCVIIETQHHD